MRFTDADVAAFAVLSGDRNPLHVDPDYARRSPFGRIVMFGMGAVLRALGSWAGGRPFAIHRLRAEFLRPLFVGVEYDLRVSPVAEDISMFVTKGDVSQMRIVCRVSSDASAWPWPEGEAATTTRREPLDPERTNIGATTVSGYAFTASTDALRRFGLGLGQLPYGELNALLWASYFIGMEYPGRQALLSDVDIEFRSPEVGLIGPIDAAIERRFDTRLALATVTGSGTGIRSMTLRAFWRPPATSLDVGSVMDRVGHSRAFAGRRALVVGSSRGFGAAVAAAFAAAGAEVVIHGRGPSAELLDLERQMRSAGVVVTPIVGDVLEASTAALIRDVARAGLDVIVLNASPVISPAALAEQTSDELVTFVADSVALAERPLRAVLPHLRPGNVIVGVSSDYLSRPRRRFAHYMAAKGAIEWLLKGASTEHPELSIVIARAPRMLTDQTNIPLDLERRASPSDVAARLLERIEGLTGQRGLAEIDLGS